MSDQERNKALQSLLEQVAREAEKECGDAEPSEHYKMIESIATDIAGELHSLAMRAIQEAHKEIVDDDGDRVIRLKDSMLMAGIIGKKVAVAQYFAAMAMVAANADDEREFASAKELVLNPQSPEYYILDINNAVKNANDFLTDMIDTDHETFKVRVRQHFKTTSD